MHKRLLYLYVLMLSTYMVNSQTTNKKVAQTHRVSNRIAIDGKLNEEEWNNAIPLTDFVMFYPDNGKEENPDKKTEVKILYDDDAIYVGAVMYDNPEYFLMDLMTINWNIVFL